MHISYQHSGYSILQCFDAVYLFIYLFIYLVEEHITLDTKARRHLQMPKCRQTAQTLKLQNATQNVCTDNKLE